MLETKEQKQIFVGSVVLIVILGLVSFWNKPNFQNTDKTDYAALKKLSDQKQQAYAKYLASLGTTPEAQNELYKEILPQEEVEKQVAAALDTAQKIDVPSKPQTPMKVAAASGKNAVVSFLNSTAPIVSKIESATDAAKNDLYSSTGNPAQINFLIADLTASLNQYSKISVPKDLVNFQNQQLIALEAYLDLAKNSKEFALGSSQNPWPVMYKNLVILAKSKDEAGKYFEQLNQQYKLSENYIEKQNLAGGSWFVPKAQAQFGFTLTTDIWQKAQTALTIAGATAVTQFMLHFLNQLANQIQKAYTITNYLYYSDALVAGQYADDYLNKYVSDATDRNLIKQFIPAVGCGKDQNLAQAFQAKADQHLGFDPNSLDPNDPDYYTKLARVGDFLSSPNGWKVYYEGIAAQAQSAAQSAANNELTGSGNKSSRDASGGILTTAQTTVDTMRAAMQNMLSSGFAGFSNDPWTSKIASQITQTFINSFVFKGTVLKEQKACIAVPLVSLLGQIPVEAAPNIPNSNP